MVHTARGALGTWMMSPCKVLALGPESLQRGWSPAPVQWDTGDSSVRRASQGTEEKLQALDLIARVCSVPVMGTVRPVTRRQVSVTAETIQPAPTVRNVAMGTMGTQPWAPPLTASLVPAPVAQVVPLSQRQRKWCARTVRLALPARDVNSVMTATLETLWAAMGP